MISLIPLSEFSYEYPRIIAIGISSILFITNSEALASSSTIAISVALDHFQMSQSYQYNSP